MHQGISSQSFVLLDVPYNVPFSSLAPKAVDAWRDGLESKNRKKLAAAIASPAENPDLFTEGWESALEQEKAIKSRGSGSAVNGNGFGDSGERRLMKFDLQNTHYIV